jgi:hypothetical protein
MPPQKALDVEKDHNWKRTAKTQQRKDAISTAVQNEWMQIPLETKTKYGYKVKDANVCFYYGKKPCTKTPDTLNVIARMMAAGIFESGADQVTISNRKVRALDNKDPKKEHVRAMQKKLKRVSERN